jgi:spermidine/putrescine transport system ATP-binding protein
MQVELKRIPREVGITFLYVTHDQEEALAMSDRIAVMERGVVKQCSSPEEVYEHPSGLFVAGFIGVSNLLNGVVQNGGVRLASGATCVADVPSDCPQGSEVHLSVRPEKIWLGELEEGMVALDGTVVERVYVGTTTQVIVELGPGMRVTALEQNVARARSDDRWQIGDRVRLGWHASTRECFGSRPASTADRRSLGGRPIRGRLWGACAAHPCLASGPTP